MTATAAALPTGGARVARTSPCVVSSAAPVSRASATTTSGTPSVAQSSSRPSSTGRAASARKAGPSTLRKAPRVKQKTARPINGRASSARGGRTTPISTPNSRISGPLRPAKSSSRRASENGCIGSFPLR